MFENYFKIGVRNLLRNKAYSFINIGGLGVGICMAMLIGFWILDELSYDRYFKNYEQIAQAYQHQTFNGKKGTQISIPIPLAAELKKSYGDDFKYIVLSSWTDEHVLAYGTQKISKRGNFMSNDAPRLMSLKMATGSWDAFSEAGAILLSQSVATAIFGNENPENELIRIDNRLDVRVAGVFEDLPANTSFSEVTFLINWEVFVSSQPWVKDAQDNSEWDNNSFQLFVQIADRAVFKKLNNRIKNIKYDAGGENIKEFKPEIFLHPMEDWHLKSSWEEGESKGGLIQYVWLFGIVGVIVLLLACINFMNLSTARSEQRAKEVGIRKSIGSVRSQLIIQFLSESFIVVVLSYIIALVLVLIFLPGFNQLAGKRMTLSVFTGSFWYTSLLFILLTSFLAGSYPALYLSSFHPIKVLKGTFRAGRFASIPRKVLVVLQFSASITLIIGTLIVHEQIAHTKGRPVGYDRSGLMMVQMKSYDFYRKYDLFRNELMKTGTILEMSESSSPITGVWSNNGGFDWEGKDPGLQAEFATIWVTHDFGNTINWTVIEGRDFSRTFSTDSSTVILNETAVAFMNMKDPVGQIMRWQQQDFEIIAVVNDLLMESPFRPVKPTVYFLGYDEANWINIKLRPGNNTHESIAKVEQVFNKLVPHIPFDFQFADETHARKFAAEERIGRLSEIFSMLAVFISCMGLFGLSSFVAEQRTKEIGIRKVLGASVISIWKMLATDFVLLVFISIFFAIPLAYYVLDKWLQNYDYRTGIKWQIFVLTGVGALFITLITVSYQSINAALKNPVRSLRAE